MSRQAIHGSEYSKSLKKLAAYYKSKSYARWVSTNIGEISEEAYEKHIKRGEAYSINGKIIIDTSPDRVLYKEMMADTAGAHSEHYPK